jgi:hypothetical protein
VPDLTDAQLDELIAAIGLDKPRPRKGPGARAACGTPSGYERHRHHGEDACDQCKTANARYKAEQQRSPVKDPSRLKPISHGTLAGYKQHRYRGETACADCLRGVADYQRERAIARDGVERKPRKKTAPKPKQYLTEEEWQARRSARNGSAL